MEPFTFAVGTLAGKLGVDIGTDQVKAFIKEPLKDAIETVLGLHGHELQRALADAFSGAVNKLMADARTQDERAVLTQIRDAAPKLFPIECHEDRPDAVLRYNLESSRSPLPRA